MLMRIKELRESAHLTQSQLAARMGRDAKLGVSMGVGNRAAPHTSAAGTGTDFQLPD